MPVYDRRRDIRLEWDDRFEIGVEADGSEVRVANRAGLVRLLGDANATVTEETQCSDAVLVALFAGAAGEVTDDFSLGVADLVVVAQTATLRCLTGLTA